MSSYDKVVKAATKPKAGGIKPKYIDPILATTFSTDDSLRSVCSALSQRLHDSNSFVLFKCLVIIHTMARNGEVDNVLSHLASESANLRLRNVQGGYESGASLTPYAQYLDERIRAYRELKHDVIRSSDRSRTQHGSGGGGNRNRLRRLTVERGLLREVSTTQKVANALLQCPFFHDDLNDELTMSAFRMSLKDLLALYTAINEGVINILEHYFEMAKSDAERALELYKRFCRQTEKVVAYLNSAKKAAHSLNVAIPMLRHAPVSLAGALEEYLRDPNFEQNRQEYKENKKVADGTSSASSRKPTTSTTSAAVPKSESKKSVTIKEPEKPERPVKPPTSNQALQDFFESIDSGQGNAFSNVPIEQSFFGVMPQQTGFGYGMGAGTDLGMGTGMGFGGGLKPQMTGYNPFLNQQQQQQGGMMPPQMIGMQAGLGMGMQQQGGFLQAQPTGFLQAQPTGFNPFRQSLMPQATGIGMGLEGSPFGGGQPSTFGQQQQPQQQQQLQSQATGLFSNGNVFSSNSSATPPQQQQSNGTPSSSSALSAFNSAFRATTSSASSLQRPASATPAGRVTSPKPLMPQKTGSRNPFAPPPGQTPSASPPPPTKTGPSLNELAMNAFNTAPNVGHYGLGASAWDGSKGAGTAQQANTHPPSSSSSGLKPQATGLIGNVASEFAFGNRQQPSSATAASPSIAATPSATALNNDFDSLSFNTNIGTPATIQAQPTGFGGSSVKPFKPESNFGASLASNPAFATSASTSNVGGLAPQQTGNPFAARVASPQPQTQQQQQQQGGLTSQQTGFAGGGFHATTHGLSAQTTGFGSSLFGAGAGAGAGMGTGSNGIQAQPTGFGGIKPFQPSSAFGQSTFGSSTAAGGQQQQGQQQGQQQQNNEPNLLQF